MAKVRKRNEKKGGKEKSKRETHPSENRCVFYVRLPGAE
jgi:hypothetical protein